MGNITKTMPIFTISPGTGYKHPPELENGCVRNTIYRGETARLSPSVLLGGTPIVNKQYTPGPPYTLPNSVLIWYRWHYQVRTRSIVQHNARNGPVRSVPVLN